jgi:S1-C subfamily serine protease
VVLKEVEEDDTLEFVDDITLRSELEVWVTFSGERKRHPATIVEWRRDERQDLALLKIESFDSIPYLKAFATEGKKPILGSDVFLIGFPGGKSILQEGDRMLASTFRGIVSRTVDYYVQIDAAVHPGVSGGPVIDGQGRLVGVVTGMQTLDDMSNSSAIGYVIPIREVASVWPPRSERE